MCFSGTLNENVPFGSGFWMIYYCRTPKPALFSRWTAAPASLNHNWLRPVLFGKSSGNFNSPSIVDFQSLVRIVDLTFRITTCRSLLAVAFRTWDLVCINLSFASRDFVCPRMTSIRIAWFVCVHRRGHHAFKKSSCVSLAHGQRWLFLLSRHRKAFLLLLIRSLL